MARTKKPAAERKRPDWARWLALPQVSVWQAVALSLDMNPDGMVHSLHDGMAGPGGPKQFEAKSFADEAQATEFEKRHRIAAERLAGDQSNDSAEGLLAVFVALALRHRWAMPDELRALEVDAPRQIAVPLTDRLYDRAPGTVLHLPAGTVHLRFGDLAHLIADAMWPEEDEDDGRTLYAGARVTLDDELQQAVDSGALRVLDPLTRGPHPFPHGTAIQSAAVHVDDLAEWLRTSRRMTVEAAELQESQAAAGAEVALSSRVPLMQTNQSRVLAALRAAGFDPLGLPPLHNGATCRARRAAKGGAGLTDATFDHAWKALRAAGELVRQKP